MISELDAFLQINAYLSFAADLERKLATTLARSCSSTLYPASSQHALMVLSADE